MSDLVKWLQGAASFGGRVFADSEEEYTTLVVEAYAEAKLRESAGRRSEESTQARETRGKADEERRR